MQTTDVQAVTVSREDLLSSLNSQQKEAVCLDWGPSLVVAGAGSGKTTVLTRRVAFLLSELAQPASSIMAVTFTNKAAAQMKKRLEDLVGPAVARRLTIGTFHSICARILRREIEAFASPEGFKWKSNFVIYDETDSLSLVKGVVSRLNLDEKVFAPREMHRAISALKNDGYTASRFAAEARNYRDGRLSEIFSLYQGELARNNALDFDDLISIFAELLDSNADVRARLNEQYRHILVDEFQDTNQSQYRFIRLLSPDERLHATSQPGESPCSLMVVGDVDQSIYSWRKADFRIILGFQKDYKNAAVIKLEENYRSTATILEAANSIIVNNSERIDKVLRCNRGQGGKIRCYAGADEIDEAYFVVEELKRLSARNISLSDCVLLYRTNAQSRAIEEVLIRSGIPYTMVGATRFYDRAEIKDVIAYLKLVYNNDDGQAFNRIVNTPRRGLGKTTLDRLDEHAKKANLSPLDAAAQAASVAGIPVKAAKTLAEFAQSVKRWHNICQVMPVSGLLELILKESTYLSKLEEEAHETRDEVAAGRVENVKELVAVAREFESIADEPNLESFLTRISLVSDLDSVNLEQEAVKLMTLHSAKGLEFSSVFLMGLEEGLFPHIRSLNSPSSMEEERRLMYVGVTRAEDRLYLTYSRKRTSFAAGGFAGPNYTMASRFLSEIKDDCLTGFDREPQTDMRGNDAFLPRSHSEPSFSGSASGSKAARSGFSQPASPARPAVSGQPSTGPAASYGRSRWDAETQKPATPASPANDKKRILSRTAPGGETVICDDAGFKPSAHFARLSVGDRVMHAKFGAGVVDQVIGENDKELYNVDFQSAGKRLLDPRFAKLVKLD